MSVFSFARIFIVTFENLTVLFEDHELIANSMTVVSSFTVSRCKIFLQFQSKNFQGLFYPFWRYFSYDSIHFRVILLRRQRRGDLYQKVHANLFREFRHGSLNSLNLNSGKPYRSNKNNCQLSKCGIQHFTFGSNLQKFR